MLFLAVPMVLLFGISEVIARILDRRRHEREERTALADDEMSEL
jgi:sec-independent protein translocase protein TatC